ncbi:MAG: hypothetical protein Ct9H300mP1_02740 [Planctomycetaceae bacterium]|nr:MAG: hypothetical protein Ct9H300mP1_02740 [Planctomycetaceae bacterium]
MLLIHGKTTGWCNRPNPNRWRGNRRFRPSVVIPDMAHFDWARPGDPLRKVLETIDGWLNDVWG